MHKTTILCQFGLFCHKLTTISPSILIHFGWELYQFVPYEDDETPSYQFPDIDEVTPEGADSYIGTNVNLPIGGTTSEGTVKRHARDTNGNLQGKANINSILDTRTYEVEFPDGRTTKFSANAIAEHMFAQCDPEGNQYLLLDSIIDHEVNDTAITDRDRYIHVNGWKHQRKTTRGVKLCVWWKNGTTTHRQNERRDHPSWAPTKEPTLSCWSPKQDRFQDLLEAICPDF